MNKNIKQLLEYLNNSFKEDIYYSVKTDSLTNVIDKIVLNCFKVNLYDLKDPKIIARITKQKYGDIATSIGWNDNIRECQEIEDYRLFYIYVKFKDNRVIYFGNYEEGRKEHTLMDGEELTKFSDILQDLIGTLM